VDIKMSDLPKLVGTRVVVEVSAGGDSWTHEGEVIAAKATDLAIKTKTDTVIIDMNFVDDIRPADPIVKVVRRKVRPVVLAQVKQHLLDRHGYPWDLVRAATPSLAMQMHDNINHDQLGHRHREDAKED
jgi:hypothetical protein